MRCLLLIAACCTPAALAQTELQKGAQYAAGSSLKSSYLGMQLVVPKGFSATFQDNNGTQVLALGQQDLAVIVILQYGVNALEYQKLLAQPFAFSEQLTLEPLENPTQRGSSLTAAFSSNAGVSARLLALPKQNGFSPVLVAISTNPNRLEPALNTVVSSLKSIAAQATTGTTNLRQEWQTALAGRALSKSGGDFNSSSNGSGSSSSSTTLGLCRDGTFLFSSRSSLSVSVPNGAGISSIDKNEFSGRWNLEYVTANQAVLVLTDETGLQKRMVLQVTQTTVLVDGVVWNAQNSSGC